MRRFFRLTLPAIAGFGLLAGALNPHLAASGVDRIVRGIANVSPALAARLRRGGERPLEDLLSEKGFALGAPVFLRIFKAENALEVWLSKGDRYALFRTYAICNWSGVLGPKLVEGDGQSPEGFYLVGSKQLNRVSAYYRAFNIGFPNIYDRLHGRTGSLLMVHGDCLSAGCFAMRDSGMEDIYRMVEAALRNGQPEVPVHIFPFRMSDRNMQAKASHHWAAFWADLKEGYDLFETTRMPPRVAVCAGRYRFGDAISGACDLVAAW